MLRRNTESTCESSKEQLTFQWDLYTKWDCGSLLFPASGLLFRWNMERIKFYQVPLDWCYLGSKYLKHLTHHISGDWHPQIHQRSCLAKLRWELDKNFTLMEVRCDRPSSSGERMNGKPQVACKWPLYFFTHIELVKIVPNQLDSSQYSIASFSNRKDYE